MYKIKQYHSELKFPAYEKRDTNTKSRNLKLWSPKFESEIPGKSLLFIKMPTFIHWKGVTAVTNSGAMSTSYAQSSIISYQKKRTASLKKGWSQAWGSNIQKDLGTSCFTRKQESYQRLLERYQKDSHKPKMGQSEHQKGPFLLRTNKQKNPVLSSRFHDYTKNKQK